MANRDATRIRMSYLDATRKMRDMDVPYERTLENNDDIDLKTAFLDSTIYKRLRQYSDSELSLSLLGTQLGVRRETIYGWLREDKTTWIT